MKNSKAKLILYLGYMIILLGILVGMAWSLATNDITYFLIIGLSSIITGILFVGFSEVIELLQKLYDCQPVNAKEEESTTESVHSAGGSTTDRDLEDVSIWQLREEAKQGNSESVNPDHTKRSNYL